MPAIDIAPEFGTKFTLTGPDGTVAVFNDTSDVNNVGTLTNLTGLDSAEVRESAENLVEFDGGIAGPSYYGRRPVVLEGIIHGHSTAEQRQARAARLTRATQALRSDATLLWTPSGADDPVMLTLRRQQPLRIEGPWNKTFQAGMVAADPRIYSSTLYNLISGETSDTLTAENQGNAETWPIFTILGPMDGTITLTNDTNGGAVVLEMDLLFQDILFIDTLKRTIMRGLRQPGSRHNWNTNPTLAGAANNWTAFSAHVATSLVTLPGGYPLPPSGATTVLQYDRQDTVESGIAATHADGVADIANNDTATVGFSYLVDDDSDSGFGSLPVITWLWRNSGGTLLDTYSVAASSLIDEAPKSDQWRRFHAVSNSAPATTDKVDIIIEFSGDHDGADKYWIADLTFEFGETGGEFYDGDHPLTTMVGSWDGTPNASASRSSTTDASGVDLVPFYSTVDFASTVWNGLSPGNNDLTLDYTPTGTGGNAFRVDWRHAWL